MPAPVADVPLMGGPRPKVLVVDDMKVYRDVLGEHLERAGFEPVMAGNGLEGLDRFSEGGIAAVITDHDMTKMNGLEMAKRIKEASPKTGIIMVSGNHQVEERFKKGLPQEIDAFIPKPINFKRQVLPHLERLVRLRE